ncbi:hypothetical protein [Micromonospora sp. NPDC005652]|uniref:hypothetical protein n=1 Tax=Micromonospora sp. NPDC005652 TaxID=3157046 RepID=UPI0033E2D7E9
MPKLAKRVFAGGQWWGVGDEPPKEVAETILNPANWATDEDENDDTATTPARRRPDGPRLAGRVYAGGQWYGPDDEVPADVARRIDNPKAWEGGKMPTFDDGEADGDDEPAEAATATAGGSTTSTDGGSGQGPTGQGGDERLRLPAPARAGKGSGKDVWEAYLKANDVKVPAGASREDMIAAAEDAGLVDKE